MRPSFAKLKTIQHLWVYNYVLSSTLLVAKHAHR